MAFNLLIMRTERQAESGHMDDWPRALREAVPGIRVNVARSVGEAMEMIGEADAAFGNIVPEVFERAERQCRELVDD